ncbi:MAG TPA: hypothetical protein VH741_05635, partial [Candidatus Limnocylindrales bacterium]
MTDRSDLPAEPAGTQPTADPPTATYRPSDYWAPRTPDHWLEPLQPAAPPRASSGGLGRLVALFIVALLAGALGAGGMYAALVYDGRLGAPPVAVPDGQPTPTPSVALTSTT